MEIPPIVSTYIDAFCRHDLDAWLATFAPDGTCSDSGTPQPLSGQALIDHYGALFAGFPDAAIETVAAHAITENLAVWRWILRGTHTGSYRGFPPTGRSLILPGCEFIAQHIVAEKGNPLVFRGNGVDHDLLQRARATGTECRRTERNETNVNRRKQGAHASCV
jgi:steroid delta-isomerase-like uncharacterized protein